MRGLFPVPLVFKKWLCMCLFTAYLRVWGHRVTMQPHTKWQSSSKSQWHLGSHGKTNWLRSTPKLQYENTLMSSEAIMCFVQNMAFQADQKVKVEIVRALGTEQLFRLLSDPDTNVLMKTLGLLRNLLSTRPVTHIIYMYCMLGLINSLPLPNKITHTLIVFPCLW